MFENLTKKLSGTFAKLKGLGKIRPGNVEEAVRDVKISLLEADVNYKVVADLVESIKNKALGSKVLESLTPYQQFIGIVNEELIRLLSAYEGNCELSVSPAKLNVHMLVGLQGCGKTTTAGKLAKFVSKYHGLQPLLVPLDTKRAAAIDQLKTIGAEIGIPVFTNPDVSDPLKLAREAIGYAQDYGFKLVIFDTAGRLHVDDELMRELEFLEDELKPQEVFFVADSMTGQDAVNSALAFSKKLALSGIIMTKMDGDARGGAALSIVSITKKPIKFIGTGEKFEALEVFHPDRIVSRILGMGDIVTLFEKTKETVDEQHIQKLAQRLKKKSFTIEDFRDQLKQVNKLGSLESIVKMIPGASKMLGARDFSSAEKEFKKIDAIINSMTNQERADHAIINGKRRLRIASGSGTKVTDVNRFLKQFLQTRKMMQKLGGLNPMNIFKKGLSPF